MFGISIWQLLIILGIIIVLFGTKKIRNLGSDLGNAVKGFKKAMDEEQDNDTKSSKPKTNEDNDVIEGESTIVPTQHSEHKSENSK